MAVAIKTDLPSSLGDEAKKYRELLELGTNRTTSGAGTYVSLTSNTSYNYTAGTQDLYAQLGVVLQPYNIDQSAWESIQATIGTTPIARYDQLLQFELYHQDTGLVNAMAVDTSGTLTFDFTLDGNTLKVVPKFTNTGSMTISVDGSTTYPIQKWDGSAYVNMSAGDITKNSNTVLRWDLTNSRFVWSGAGGTIKSIQRGTTSFNTGVTTLNITITAVSTNASVVSISFKSSGGEANQETFTAEITNSTNLQFVRTRSDSPTDTFEWTVIEFNNVKSLQKLTTSVASNTINTTITEVDVNKTILFSNCRCTRAQATGNSSSVNFFVKTKLLNSTTIQDNGASSFDVKHQIIEFN